jgi:hypothetical protein
MWTQGSVITVTLPPPDFSRIRGKIGNLHWGPHFGPENEPDPWAFSSAAPSVYIPLTNAQKSPSQWAIRNQGDSPVEESRVAGGEGVNSTKAAKEHNAENLPVIRDKALADKCAANWQAHSEHLLAPINRQSCTPW